MSFPIWFDDSLIKQKSIKQIKRSLYVSSTENDKIGIEPKAIYVYDFNRQGELTNVSIDHFYENIQVSSTTFDYLTGKDENGFAKVKMKANLPGENDESTYLIYEKEPAHKKFIVYKNNRSGDYLFYMLNRENWGALSIDSILSPTPDDIITLGSPIKPVKTYQVNNMVKEEHVIKYQYEKKSGHIMTVRYDKFPFQHKRSIRYDKKGNCTGFIDSTFSQGVYLNRKESKFDFKEDLPVSLTQKNESIKATSKFFQLEHFEYSYFED